MFKANEEIMSHSAFKKDTKKFALLEAKGLIQIIVKFKTENIWYTFLSTNIPLGDMKC